MMNSWISIPAESDFSIYNIPFGIGTTGSGPFVCTRIGDQVLNLKAVAETGFFRDIITDYTVFSQRDS